MNNLKPVRHLSISINRSPADVYAYASRPERMPEWAAGLGSGITRKGEDWEAQTPIGPVHVRFTPPNPHGILDHTVTLPDGAKVHMPVRVVPNGGGSEVVFHLFREPNMDDRQYADDAAAVERDLATLKRLLETQA